MAANRKILIAMSMLLVAIFASISVTFAWFSTSTRATAIFTLTIRESDDYLYIKTGDGIAQERMDDYSAQAVQLKDINYREQGGAWALVTEEGNTASRNNYILQSYTLYTNNPNKSVYLDTVISKVTSVSRHRAFSPMDKTYWLTRGVNNENIARFYGTTDITQTNDTNTTVAWREGTAGETVYYFNSSGMYDTVAANAIRVMGFQSGFSELPEAAPLFIWEPNANAGYDAKDDSGNFIYEQVSSYHRNSVWNALTDVSVDRTDPYNAVEYSVNTNSKLLDTTVWRPVPQTDDDYYGNAPYRAHVTVVVWLEGKDADCFNVISSDTVYMDFALSLL